MYSQKSKKMLKVGPFSLEKGLSLAIFLLSFTIRDTKLNSHYLPTLLHGTERFLCDIWAGRLLFKKTNVAWRRWCSLSLPRYRLWCRNRWGRTCVWKCIIKYFIAGCSRSKYMTSKQIHAFEGKSSSWTRCRGQKKFLCCFRERQHILLARWQKGSILSCLWSSTAAAAAVAASTLSICFRKCEWNPYQLRHDLIQLTNLLCFIFAHVVVSIPHAVKAPFFIHRP